MPCSQIFVVFFFFQAEDGIRDYKVTGVQTCALPISSPGSISNTPVAEGHVESSSSGSFAERRKNGSGGFDQAPAYLRHQHRLYISARYDWKLLFDVIR